MKDKWAKNVPNRKLNQDFLEIFTQYKSKKRSTLKVYLVGRGYIEKFKIDIIIFFFLLEMEKSKQ